MTGVQHPVIRTPDQRIRVFVSSTLRELADERRAARAAIERLRLAPVMFELGARPHPPRELYRSYLEQSDVFVGIYGESYGWVAPDEEISGLEDEYNLAPRVDAEAHLHQGDRDHREERLTGPHRPHPAPTITRAYLPFDDRRRARRSGSPTTSRRCSPSASTSREPDAAPAAPPIAPRMPVALHARRIGREADIEPSSSCSPMTRSRLVTPGRAGRHRQEPARHRGRRCGVEVCRRTGLVFVLARARAPSPHCSCRRSPPSRSARLRSRQHRRRHRSARGDRRMLIVLDNFEQMLEAAPAAGRALRRAAGDDLPRHQPRVLRVRIERVYEVPPLTLPDPTLAIAANTATGLAGRRGCSAIAPAPPTRRST